uniref:Uncharacterized protein n=1 Tax=Globisporangium ultimum (strain ATCC 200006 / CBS 805.95 / DAOM BR144) TaxID=431595 RepID=K3WF72_GLOUD
MEPSVFNDEEGDDESGADDSKPSAMEVEDDEDSVVAPYPSVDGMDHDAQDDDTTARGTFDNDEGADEDREEKQAQLRSLRFEYNVVHLPGRLDQKRVSKRAV